MEDSVQLSDDMVAQGGLHVGRDEASTSEAAGAVGVEIVVRLERLGTRARSQFRSAAVPCRLGGQGGQGRVGRCWSPHPTEGHLSLYGTDVSVQEGPQLLIIPGLLTVDLLWRSVGRLGRDSAAKLQTTLRRRISEGVGDGSGDVGLIVQHRLVLWGHWRRHRQTCHVRKSLKTSSLPLYGTGSVTVVWAMRGVLLPTGAFETPYPGDVSPHAFVLAESSGAGRRCLSGCT